MCDQYHRWDIFFDCASGLTKYARGGPFHSRETNSILVCQDCGRLGQVVSNYDTTNGVWKRKNTRDYRQALKRMYA